jgi:hypothetical protein
MDVIVAVNIDTRITPVNIKIKAVTRPKKVFGCLSPYPTAVMVTAANQIPDPIPWMALPPKCSWFSFLSNNHTIILTISKKKNVIINIFKQAKTIIV